MTPGLALAEALRGAIAFEAQGERVGNLTCGRGTVAGRPVRAAFLENRVASGSVGTAEAERLVALLTVVARERSPLVLHLDSAGARVSEGLKALGAFRALYRAALDAAQAGAPIAAVLGRNCYGGSSMLAHVAARRLMSAETQLAMSGPAVLASAAGVGATDEMFRAMAVAALAAPARAQVAPENTVWSERTDVAAWLGEALAASAGGAAARWHARHAALAGRFDAAAAARAPFESVRRRDLDRLYDGGYEARESQGFLDGHGTRGGREEAFVGIVGSQPLALARAWRFSERVWSHAVEPPAALEVYLDCASHAPRLDDERAVLSEFIVDMGFALAALAARGTAVGLTVLGKAGGGVYVALAAPAARVASVPGADIQVLPGAAIAAILGESQEAAPAFPEYQAARVADQEIKLGLVPGTA